MELPSQLRAPCSHPRGQNCNRDPSRGVEWRTNLRGGPPANETCAPRTHFQCGAGPAHSVRPPGPGDRDPARRRQRRPGRPPGRRHHRGGEQQHGDHRPRRRHRQHRDLPGFLAACRPGLLRARRLPRLRHRELLGGRDQGGPGDGAAPHPAAGDPFPRARRGARQAAGGQPGSDHHADAAHLGVHRRAADPRAQLPGHPGPGAGCDRHRR